LRRSKLLRVAIATLIFSSFSWFGCAVAVGVKVDLPPRPAICDLQGPALNGRVQGDSVVLDKATALRLRDYIVELKVCVVERDGHIEKLENRLKAVGQ
jgi:hypothetical protein